MTPRLLEQTLSAPLERGALALRRLRVAGAPTRAAVLLIHGFGMNRHMWHLPRRSFAVHLAMCGYDVFLLELRGVGDSRRLGSRAAAHPDEHVEEDLPRALDAIARASGHPRAFLIGHSLGGLVSCCFTARDPARIQGVVTLSGSFIFASQSRFLQALCALGPRILPTRRGGGLTLPIQPIARMLWAGRLISDTRLGSALMPIHAWTAGTIERDILREHIRVGWDFSSLGLLRALFELGRHGEHRALDGEGYRGLWGRCDVPLLVVCAEQDTLVSPADARAAFEASTSSDRALVTLGRSRGHAPYGHLDLVIGREAPREVWPLITRWLEQRTQAA